MAGEGTVFVTGGARGIGRAIAERLAENGWIRQIDLADRAGTVGFAQQICEEFPLTALVNNAGILVKEPFEEMTLDAWDRTMAVNVTAPLILAQTIGPRLSTGGSIVNIASTEAFVGSFRGIAYSASKATLSQ